MRFRAGSIESANIVDSLLAGIADPEALLEALPFEDFKLEGFENQ